MLFRSYVTLHKDIFGINSLEKKYILLFTINVKNKYKAIRHLLNKMSSSSFSESAKSNLGKESRFCVASEGCSAKPSQLQKFFFKFSDSYNYTFNSMGSVLAIIILAYILQDSIDKSMIIYLHTSSMFGIIYINYKYYTRFDSVATIKRL